MHGAGSPHALVWHQSPAVVWVVAAHPAGLERSRPRAIKLGGVEGGDRTRASPMRTSTLRMGPLAACSAVAFTMVLAL